MTKQELEEKIRSLEEKRTRLVEADWASSKGYGYYGYTSTARAKELHQEIALVDKELADLRQQSLR